MATEIVLSASEVWEYFQTHKEDLEKHMHLIASNPEYGTEVYITEDTGFPNIVVTADGQQVYERVTISDVDCNKTVEEVYSKYLTANAVFELTDAEDYLYADANDDVEEIINEREDALYGAVYDFLSLASDEYFDFDSPDVDDIIEDCKEHFLEYIARKHGVRVYRPMVLEYNDGTEEVSDFPYEDMEFDDPDNPLYK